MHRPTSSLLPFLLLTLLFTPLTTSLPKQPCHDFLHNCDNLSETDTITKTKPPLLTPNDTFPHLDPKNTLIHPRGGGGGPAKSKSKQKPINFNATWDCWYNNKPLWSNYQFRGKDWYNVTEKQFKKAIRDAGMVTKWQFGQWEDEEGHEHIAASWRLPLGCKKKVAMYLSPVIGFTPDARRNFTLEAVNCRQQ